MLNVKEYTRYRSVIFFLSKGDNSVYKNGMQQIRKDISFFAFMIWLWVESLLHIFIHKVQSRPKYNHLYYLYMHGQLAASSRTKTNYLALFRATCAPRCI